MRLKAINIFSSFLGTPFDTRKRTRFLREEAEFLDYELYKTVKYIDNTYCKQLNIECDENINDIIIGAPSFDGYPTTKLPFHLDEYNCKTNYQKGMFWINSLKEIFSLLIKGYEFDKDKIERFLTYLESKYDDDYIYENVRTELAKHHE